MPRRTRSPIRPAQKRTPPIISHQRAEERARQRGRDAEPEAVGEQTPIESADVAEPVEFAPTVAAQPYMARRTAVPAPASARPPVSGRQARSFVTDYGNIVSELKRVGLTFGGLIVLLIVVARLLALKA